MLAMQLRPLFPVLVPVAAASLYGWAVFIATFSHPGAIGLDYNAPGTDWMVLYSGLRLATANRFALMLDGAELTAHLNATFVGWLSAPLYYRPWLYPPSFLVVLLPFGALSFVASYAAFQITSAALLVGALLYKPDCGWAAALVAAGAVACPAASINAVFGQCGFLVAGVLILGFRLVAYRPLLAGAVLGLLSIKPQFGLMVPVALLTSRQWRAMAGAAVSGLSWAALSAMCFGPALWIAWARQVARTYVDPSPALGNFVQLWGTTVDACALMLGAPPLLAVLAQVVSTATAAACVYWSFRSRNSIDRKIAVMLGCTVLAAPHAGPYDAIMLTVAGMLWLADQRAPKPRHGIVLLVLWLLPMLEPPEIVPIGRTAPLIILGFIILALRPSSAGTPLDVTAGVNAQSESDRQAGVPSG